MKKIFRRHGILITGLLLLCLKGTAQKTHSFTIKQAVDYAKQNAVQIKNAMLDVLMQEQVNREVTSIALPQINGSAGITDYLNIPVTLIPGEITGQPAGTFTPVKFGTKYSSNATLTLSQIVFDGQVFIALKARDGTIDFQKKILDMTEENIKANIYKVYYQLVTGTKQIELLDANVERLQKLKTDVQVMYKNGFVEKLDIDKLTVQIANLETEKLRANSMLKNGYSGLKLLIGLPIKDSLVLTDKLTDDEIKASILEATQYKYSDRNDYQFMQITNKLNGLNVRRYKLSRIPTFALVGAYSKQAQRTEFDIFGKGDWFTSSYIGLTMRVPIFNGFSLRAKTEQAKLQLQKTQNQTTALEISIDREVEMAKNNFTTAIASMDYQNKNKTLAELVYQQTKKKYEIGTGSVTEINTAQLDLKTAETHYITALYDAIIARVDLLKATGKL